MDSKAESYKSFLQKIYLCKVPFSLEVRPTKPKKRLGTYYYRRRKIIIHEGWAETHDCHETAIHEYAHHIHATEFGMKERKQKPHGREFWMIYGQLLCRARQLGLFCDESLPAISFPVLVRTIYKERPAQETPDANEGFFYHLKAAGKILLEFFAFD